MIQNSLQKITEYFLEKYSKQEYILFQKARVFLYLSLSLLFLLSSAIIYTVAIQEKLMLGIIIPEAAGLMILSSTLILLRKGYFQLASQILIVISMATCWIVIFLDTSVAVTRLDTVAFILTLVALSSLLVDSARWAIIFYTLINIAIMIVFMYLNYDSIITTRVAKIDWVVDTSVALLFLGIIGWNIHSINSRALSRAAKEVKDRLEKEEELYKKNQELQATNEELEATNEEFEATNEELTASQMELTESEEKFRLIAEKSQIGIIIAQDERIRYVNQAVANIIGYSPEEMLAWSPGGYANLLPPEDLKDFMKKARSRQNGEITGAVNEEIRMITREGEYIWLEANSTTVQYQGSPAELVALINISDRKNTQEMMVQSEKMITIGGLSAGMAHEINNPLGIILHGIQNTMRRLDPDSEKNRQKAEQHGIDLYRLKGFLADQNIISYLAGIQDAGNRASQIVSSLLQFSRRTSGNPEPVNILTLVDKALSIAEKDYDLQKSYDFKKINIEKNFPSDLPKVTCIETEIEQVLLNLFKNAAQAMREISNPDHNPQISISASQQEDNLILTVADNGPGMPEATVKYIFDPFFTTKDIGRGTGLGLSVTYFIITVHHNGQIRVDSTPGSGTLFTITLPL